MRVVFRVDASLQIGTGHVMRCLTLAEELRNKGAQVEFICRRHKGHLTERISSQGFNVHALKVTENNVKPASPGNFEDENTLPYAQWLAASQTQDADECRPLLDAISPDWLIVDHYAIDHDWELALKGTYKKLMVIDDLANRNHQCDLLLDQTYGRLTQDYQYLVPTHCRTLLGSQYALLRPEFSQWREYSLKRRRQSQLKILLVTLGGVDPNNVTGRILNELKFCMLPKDIQINVVMGPTAPHLDNVKTLAKEMPHITQVKVNVNNMAEIMANADLAIGAAGATTWERCCLGLPSLLWVLAENQKIIAKNLKNENIVGVFDRFDQICQLLNSLAGNLTGYSMKASSVSDGKGVEKVAKAMYE
jgi:UDP-2,4-diacetamido-2,4,6-trideoxy-beta-L-altropyranose hydrolase